MSDKRGASRQCSPLELMGDYQVVLKEFFFWVDYNNLIILKQPSWENYTHLPELFKRSLMSMLHAGVLSFFCKSHTSTLSRKVRVNCDSLIRASLQPRLWLIKPQHTLEQSVRKPARNTPPSPGRQHRHEFVPHTHSCHIDSCLRNLPSKSKDALRLQLALIWLVCVYVCCPHAHLFTLLFTSVG